MLRGIWRHLAIGSIFLSSSIMQYLPHGEVISGPSKITRVNKKNVLRLGPEHLSWTPFWV